MRRRMRRMCSAWIAASEFAPIASRIIAPTASCRSNSPFLSQIVCNLFLPKVQPRSRIAILDDLGRFSSSDLLHFNASDLGGGIKRQMTVDYDGNLWIYSLNASTGFWSVTWQALLQPCNVKGVCGKNAICVYAPLPTCTCPPGFTVEDAANWNSGCKPTFNQTLLLSKKVNFLQIPHTDFYGFDLNATNPVTLESCRDMCVEDFRCVAFSYRLLGQGFCFIKSAMLNGYAAPEFPANGCSRVTTTAAALVERMAQRENEGGEAVD